MFHALLSPEISVNTWERGKLPSYSLDTAILILQMRRSGPMLARDSFSHLAICLQSSDMSLFSGKLQSARMGGFH